MLTAGRGAAGGALVALLVACAGSPSSAGATDSPAGSPAQSKAADLRTHLDVVLAEHVMIVAKESAAALTHADEYAAYAALLAANADDLDTILSRAFGSTAAGRLRSAWDQQNDLLVDYAIGAATHDDTRTNGDASGLTTTFVPQYAQQLATESGLDSGVIRDLLTQQLLLDRSFIDDYAAGKFAPFYTDLDHAYSHASELGDVTATRIAAMFPDKFPGKATPAAVDARVRFNLLLQEDAYLATMATSAKAGSRTSEAAAAATAQSASEARLQAAFATAKGDGFVTRFAAVWSARNDALSRYAAGDHSAGASVTATFVADFASLTGANRASVANQASATLKVVDDQLAKSTGTVADDDRAAATAMQPVADSIPG